MQGPGDDFTNPKAVLLLPGHKSEVQQITVDFYTSYLSLLALLGFCLRIQSYEVQTPGNRVRSYNSCLIRWYNTTAHPSNPVNSSKDAVVNLWNLPDPPPGGFAEQPASPRSLDYFAKDEQGDLTSLHWNSEGTLIAIGSYDSILRICTSSGDLYFQHPQHQVIIDFCQPVDVLTVFLFPLRRAPYLQRGFRNQAVGY